MILQGSRGITHPAWAYDLFLTAAPVDGIKVWDLRTNRCGHMTTPVLAPSLVSYRCVRCLSTHVNRCLSVSAEFSPCSNYIATGSEDRAVSTARVSVLMELVLIHKLTESVTVSVPGLHI